MGWGTIGNLLPKAGQNHIMKKAFCKDVEFKNVNVLAQYNVICVVCEVVNKL